jgi:hypothetical protein
LRVDGGGTARSYRDIHNKGLGRAPPSLPLARVLLDRQGRVAALPGMAHPVRYPAGLEPAPIHTHPLSARANGSMRTREHAAAMAECMRLAALLLTGGFELRVDIDIRRHGERFVEARGERTLRVVDSFLGSLTDAA